MQNRIHKNITAHLTENRTAGAILLNALLAAISLFLNGFGVYLTIHANIGAAPWDVFTLGLSKTTGMIYGNTSILISVIILTIDILMREPIGIAMLIDSVVVGKSVDFFNRFSRIQVPETIPAGVLMALAGLVVIGYTQYLYMRSALGCGPRDTLLVGLKKRLKSIPIGAVSIALLCVVTLIGWLLGGKVGIGTILCAFLAGPIMQFFFDIVHVDASAIRHQSIRESAAVFVSSFQKKNRP